MVCKVDENLQLDSRDWNIYLRILKERSRGAFFPKIPNIAFCGVKKPVHLAIKMSILQEQKAVGTVL